MRPLFSFLCDILRSGPVVAFRLNKISTPLCILTAGIATSIPASKSKISPPDLQASFPSALPFFPGWDQSFLSWSLPPGSVAIRQAQPSHSHFSGHLSPSLNTENLYHPNPNPNLSPKPLSGTRRTMHAAAAAAAAKIFCVVLIDLQPPIPFKVRKRAFPPSFLPSNP